MREENKNMYVTGLEDGVAMTTENLSAILKSYESKTVLDYEDIMHIFADTESNIAPNILELEQSDETGKILQGTGIAYGFVYAKMKYLQILAFEATYQQANHALEISYKWTAEDALDCLCYIGVQFKDAVDFFKHLGYQNESQFMSVLEFFRYGSKRMWAKFFEERKAACLEKELLVFEEISLDAKEAYKQGLTHGIIFAKETFDTFLDNNPITREQITALFWDVLKRYSKETLEGEDSDEIFKNGVDLLEYHKNRR